MDRFREVAVAERLPFVATVATAVGYGLSQVNLRVRSLKDVLAEKDNERLPKSYWRDRNERIFLCGRVVDDRNSVLKKVGGDASKIGTYVLDSNTGTLYLMDLPEEYSHIGALEVASKLVEVEYVLFCVWDTWDVSPVDKHLGMILHLKRVQAVRELDEEITQAVGEDWQF